MIVEDWEVVKSFFPKNWRWLALRKNALKGLRKDKDPEQLLRGLLIHLGCGHSLRETSVRLEQSGMSELSDVALLKRLKKSRDWLHALCASLLREVGKLEKRIRGVEFRLFDSSIVKEHGQTGSQWRIHYSLRIPSLRCDFFKLTSAKGKGNGDTLFQYPIKKGDYIVADRGYSHVGGIHYAASASAYLCVRVNQQNLKLNDLAGLTFPLLTNLETTLKQAGTIGQWDVVVPGQNSRGVVGRICAIRKSVEAINIALKKLRHRASKNGERLSAETLQFAKYIILFTTFPEKKFTSEDILEGYRFRWQIELIFKRFKQLAELGHLPKTDPVSVEAWLYGKLFVAILTQRIIDHANLVSPWGYDLEKIANPKPLARI